MVKFNKDLKPKLSIVMLTCGHYAMTEEAILSLNKHIPGEFQLILVDNGDGIHNLDQNFLSPNDILIKFKSNRGFIVANNMAVNLVESCNLMFLNNDIVCRGGGWVDSLVREIERFDIVGPTIQSLYPDHGSRIFRHGYTPNNEWVYVEGWCLIMKTDLFKRLGGFDDRYFPAYSEDSDFSFKVTHQIYGKIGRVSLPIMHLGGRSISMLSSSFDNIDGEFGLNNNRKLYEKWVGK